MSPPDGSASGSSPSLSARSNGAIKSHDGEEPGRKTVRAAEACPESWNRVLELVRRRRGAFGLRNESRQKGVAGEVCGEFKSMADGAKFHKLIWPNQKPQRIINPELSEANLIQQGQCIRGTMIRIPRPSVWPSSLQRHPYLADRSNR